MDDPPLSWMDEVGDKGFARMGGMNHETYLFRSVFGDI
jgi:hypothetical protein